MTTAQVPDRTNIERIAPAALIALLVAPSVIWILNDNLVWPWDQALYGEWTLRTWRARLLGPLGWFDAMVHVWGGRPPLIVWAGQFFVPLRHSTGSFESAMLLLNIVTASATLALVYIITRSLGTDAPASLIAVLACGGSQLFIGMTHQYLVEMTQCFTAAGMMFAAWRAEQRPLRRTIALTVIAIALSFLAKASSAPFVLPFLAYIAVALFIGRKRAGAASRPSDVLLLIGAILIISAAIAWYVLNWEPTVAHFVEATSSDIALNYGSAVVLSTKLRYWVSTLGLALSPFAAVSIATAAAILVALAVAIARVGEIPLRRRAEVAVENGTLFAIVLLGTVCLTLLAYSLQITEDTRFILPLMPMIGVLLGFAISVFRTRIATNLFFLILAGDAIVAHAYSFRVDPFGISPISRQ